MCVLNTITLVLVAHFEVGVDRLVEGDRDGNQLGAVDGEGRDDRGAGALLLEDGGGVAEVGGGAAREAGGREAAAGVWLAAGGGCGVSGVSARGVVGGRGGGEVVVALHERGCLVVLE